MISYAVGALCCSFVLVGRTIATLICRLPGILLFFVVVLVVLCACPPSFLCFCSSSHFCFHTTYHTTEWISSYSSISYRLQRVCTDNKYDIHVLLCESDHILYIRILRVYVLRSLRSTWYIHTNTYYWYDLHADRDRTAATSTIYYQVFTTYVPGIYTRTSSKTLVREFRATERSTELAPLRLGVWS